MELEIIMRQPNLNARLDLALDYLLDHFSVKDNVQRILLKNSIEPIFQKLSLIMPEIYEPYKPPKKNGEHPMVQAGQKIIKSVNEWSDVYWASLGFKDGIVFQTGTETKIYLCNGNLSHVDDVYYRNWTTIYGSNVFPVNFQTDWRTQSYNTAILVMLALQWPFNSLYSCYWSVEDLVFRYSSQDVPLAFQPK